MIDFLTQVAQSINASIEIIEFTNNNTTTDFTTDLISNSTSTRPTNGTTSTIHLLDYQDSIYRTSTRSESNYPVDKMIITREQLSSIKLNQLSEFMRSEILQYQIGKWNNHSPSTIQIDFPSTDITCETKPNNSTCTLCKKLIDTKINCGLDELTFHLKGNESKQYNLKDYWPVNGADLAIKAEEGFRLRSLLGLEQDQEIKVLSLSNHSSQSLPTSTANSSQTSIVSEFESMNTRSLFHRSSNDLSLSTSLSTLISQDTKPNNFTVEEYHAYINKPLPQTPIEILPRQFQISRMVYIRGDIWTHSTILEDSSESLPIENNNRDSSSSNTLLSSNESETPITLTNRVTYTYPQNNELRNAILGMMSDTERNEISNNTNFNPTRSNTEDVLVDNNSHNIVLRTIDNESLTELADQNRISNISDRNPRVLRRYSSSNLGLHYRSNSPVSIIRSSSDSLFSNLDSNINNDID
jgi:hypothetical protein